jgi:anti-sigma factor RsiW
MSGLFEQLRFGRDHRWAQGQMSAYVDGDLALSARSRMERHVVECDECERVLAGLRAMLEALHRLPAASGNEKAVAIVASVRARLP